MVTVTTSSGSTQSLVSALGSGSGIDLSKLADDLATAQFSTRKDRLTTKADLLDKQISAASTLKNAVSNLSSSIAQRVRQGDLSPQPQIANSSVAKASLSGSRQPSGSYSLEVTALAKQQSLASQAFSSSSTTTGSGTLTLRFGSIDGGTFTEDTSHTAATITISSGATLSDVASAINSAKAGVTAYVANTTNGAQLVLKGTEGAKNGFILEASEASGDPGLSQLAWTPSSSTGKLLSTAQDASFKIDGLDMTSASNTVTDAIPGVTLTLTGTNADSPTSVTFSDTTSAISTMMQDLTDALNQVVSELNTDTDASSGDLARDDGARSLRRTLSGLAGKTIMTNATGSAPRTLADLGLSTQRDGTFSLDTSRLSATLKSDPQGAAAMFTNGLYGVYATIDSIARNVASSSDPGTLGGSIARYTSQKSKITDEQSKLDNQQEALRTQLAKRFTWADTQVSNSKSTQTMLQNQIDAWNSKSN